MCLLWTRLAPGTGMAERRPGPQRRPWLVASI